MGMFRSLYLFLMIFPFFIITVYGNTVVVRMGLLVYMCLALWIFLILKKRVEKKVYLPEIFLVMYAIWAAISAFLSGHPYISLFGTINRHEGLLTLYSYFTIFYVAVRFAPLDKYKRILAGLVGISLISGLYGVVQKFVLGTDRIKSFFGNPNFYGSYLVIMLLLAVFLTLTVKRRSQIILFSGAASFLFLNMLYTGTRSAIVGLFVGLTFFTVFVWMKQKPLRKRYVGVLLCLLLVFGAVNLLEHSSYLQRITSIFGDASQVVKDEDAEHAGSSRWKLWEIALPLVEEYPVFGSGPDTLAYVYDQKAFCDFIQGHNCQVDKAHNEYLQIAITMGIPSLIFYLLFLGTVLLGLWKSLTKSRGHKQLLLAGFITILLAYTSQAFFNISVVPVAPYFWFMLGMGYRLSLNE